MGVVDVTKPEQGCALSSFNKASSNLTDLKLTEILVQERTANRTFLTNRSYSVRKSCKMQKYLTVCKSVSLLPEAKKNVESA